MGIEASVASVMMEKKNLGTFFFPIMRHVFAFFAKIFYDGQKSFLHL